MEFEDRNSYEIQRMVDRILEIGVEWLGLGAGARIGTLGSGTRFCGMGAGG
jgi:hypothetical protein